MSAKAPFVVSRRNPSSFVLVALCCFAMRLEASAAPLAGQIILADSFDRADQVLDDAEPEAPTGPGSVFRVYRAHGASGSAWRPVSISSNQVLLDSDVGLSAPIASSGSYVKPAQIRIAARAQLADLGDGDAYARGIGLGFFSSETARPNSFMSARGLVLERSGRVALVVDDGQDSGPGIDYDPALFGGAAFDPAEWHRLSYEINTADGDVSDIQLDDRPIGDLTTSVFTDTATRYAGFWVSSLAQFRISYVDDFAVTAVPEPTTALVAAFAALLVRRRRRAARGVRAAPPARTITPARPVESESRRQPRERSA